MFFVHLQKSSGKWVNSNDHNNLLSSSIIVTVVWPGSPIVTEDELMMSVKFSTSSVTPSLTNMMLSEVIVDPAGNSTLYGPE